jgi:hypothetical protein
MMRINKIFWLLIGIALILLAVQARAEVTVRAAPSPVTGPVDASKTYSLPGVLSETCDPAGVTAPLCGMSSQTNTTITPSTVAGLMQLRPLGTIWKVIDVSGNTGSVARIVEDTSCNQSKYWQKDTFCHDTSGNAWYVGTGAAISTIGGGSSNVTLGTMTVGKICTATAATEITCNTSTTAAANDPSMNYTGVAAHYVPAWNGTTKQYDPSGALSVTSIITSADASTNTSHASTYTASGTVTASGDISGNSVHSSGITSSGILSASGQITGSLDASANTMHTSTLTVSGAAIAASVSANSSLKLPQTTNTNLNTVVVGRDPSDNTLKTMATLTGAISGDTASTGACYAADKTLGTCASANATIIAADISATSSLKTPLIASAGPADSTDASAQYTVRSAADNKIKTLSYAYAPMYRDVNASITLSSTDLLAKPLVLDVSPTTTTTDLSINIGPIYGKDTGCQFQGALVNILLDSSSTRIGFRSTDSSQNFMIYDASGNADTASLYKNVYVDQASNEMIIALWGKAIKVTATTHYCVWAVKMVGNNKVVAGTNILKGSN